MPNMKAADVTSHGRTLIHEPGNQAKTVTAVMKLGYWWVGMHATAKQVIKGCRGCQLANAHRNRQLKTHFPRFASIPLKKWQEVSVDLCGPLPLSKHGFTYLLVVMDNFTKYVILIPLRNKESETVAKALFYDVFMTHGFPLKILSDNGQEFMSSMSQQLWKLLDIHKVTTAPQVLIQNHEDSLRKQPQ